MSLPLPSTFMPLPLAIMIPFMGMQSMVMAKQFGEGFQYGKRRISAMSNDEFNKLTMGQLMQSTNNELKGLIPDMKLALEAMRPFQRDIFVEMLAAMKEAIKLGLDVAAAGVGVDTSKPFVDPHKFLSPTEIEEHKAHGHLGGIKVPPAVTEPSPARPKIDKCTRLHQNWSRLMLESRRLVTQRVDIMNRAKSKPARTKGVLLQQANRMFTRIKKINTQLNAGINNPNNRECALSWTKP